MSVASLNLPNALSTPFAQLGQLPGGSDGYLQIGCGQSTPVPRPDSTWTLTVKGDSAAPGYGGLQLQCQSVTPSPAIIHYFQPDGSVVLQGELSCASVNPTGVAPPTFVGPKVDVGPQRPDFSVVADFTGKPAGCYMLVNDALWGTTPAPQLSVAVPIYFDGSSVRNRFGGATGQGIYDNICPKFSDGLFNEWSMGADGAQVYVAQNSSIGNASTNQLTVYKMS